ncbi:MAG: YfhO family protein [Clostridia bacterium]|nr:YfhO family protein [Clostridia bacterium]
MKSKAKINTFTVTLTAFVMAAAIALPVMLANKGNFYLVGDYMTQQIPFINECRRLLKSGAPFWSSNTFLGANFLGTYSFYNYASPFYWPLFLMPESMTGIGVGFMFIIKHALAAATAFIYLKKYVNTPHLSFIGALIYAFSGFAMDSSYFYHFHDVMALFPLLLYLTDEALESRKCFCFSVYVTVNAITNYYFLVSTSVFILFYLLFKVKYTQLSLKKAFKCLIYYCSGCLLASFLLLPTAFSLLETHKATSSFSNALISGLSSIPKLLKVIKGIILPSEGVLGSATGFSFSNFNSNVAFLPFFGAVFIFIAIKIKSNEWHIKLFKFLFILSLIPFGNGIFNLFTNMSYTRWWYSFTLIGILVSLKIAESKQSNAQLYKSSAKTIAILSAITVGLPLIIKILCAYILNKETFNILPGAAVSYLNECGLTDKFTMYDLRYAAVFILLTAVTYVPLLFFIKNNWLISARRTIPAVVLICTLSYGVYLANEAEIWNTHKNSDYKGADISADSSTEYTSRKYYDYSFANYPAVINQPGITAFHSFKSHSTNAFCNLVGYADTLHTTATRYFDTPAIQSVLSIETITDKNGQETKAEYYSPFGYAYEYYVICDKYEYTTNKKENNKRIELMTAACFADEETAKKLSAVIKPFNFSSDFDWKEQVKINKATAATEFILNSEGFSCNTSGSKTRLIYFSIPHDNGWKAYINGEETDIYTINGGLMGIIVPAGESEIEFEFTTPGLKAGIILSIIVLLILLVFYIIDKKKAH